MVIHPFCPWENEASLRCIVFPFIPSLPWAFIFLKYVPVELEIWLSVLLGSVGLNAVILYWVGVGIQKVFSR